MVDHEAAVDAAAEGGVLAVVHGGHLVGGTGELVAAQTPLGAVHAACGHDRVDARAVGEGVAQGVDLRAVTLDHHFLVAQEAAGGHEGLLAAHVHLGAVAVNAVHAHDGAVLNDEALQSAVEHELGAALLAPLLKGQPTILAAHALLLRAEADAHGIEARAVVVGAHVGLDAELGGEHVHGLTGELEALLHDGGDNRPVRPVHDVVEGVLDGDVNAGFLLGRGLNHKRATCQGAVGEADEAALLNHDDALACAAGLNGGKHAGRASTGDDDVCLEGIACGLLSLGRGGLGQGYGGAHGGSGGGACGGDEVAAGHVHCGIPFCCGACTPICGLPDACGLRCRQALRPSWAVPSSRERLNVGR